MHLNSHAAWKGDDDPNLLTHLVYYSYSMWFFALLNLLLIFSQFFVNFSFLIFLGRFQNITIIILNCKMQWLLLTIVIPMLSQTATL